jgi:hypothetical protein
MAEDSAAVAEKVGIRVALMALADIVFVPNVEKKNLTCKVKNVQQ